MTFPTVRNDTRIAPTVKLRASGGDRHPLAFALRNGLYGLNDLNVSGTTTQITCNSAPDLLPCGVRIDSQQRNGIHQHAGCAVAALNSPMFHEGGLERVKLLALEQPFHGLDIGPLSLTGKNQAGVHGLSVHQNRASPTLPYPTALFTACQPKVLPQYVQQPGIGRSLDRLPLAIHSKIHPQKYHLLAETRLPLTHP